jgi:Fe-S-cluster containining protein
MSTFDERCRKMVDEGFCYSECCGPFPMNETFFNKHKDKAQPNYTATQVLADAYLYQANGDCCFLKSDRTCAIYEDRPSVCRRFGDESHIFLCCPKMDRLGNRRSPGKRDQLAKKAVSERKRVLRTLSGLL